MKYVYAYILFIDLFIYIYIYVYTYMVGLVRDVAYLGPLAWGASLWRFCFVRKVGASCFATILLLKFSKTAKPRSDAALVWEQSECLVRPAYPYITTTRCVDQPRQAQRSPAWSSTAQPQQQRGSAQTSPAEK